MENLASSLADEPIGERKDIVRPIELEGFMAVNLRFVHLARARVNKWLDMISRLRVCRIK